MDSPTQMLPGIDNEKEIFIEIYPLNKLYSDDTGRFPVRARSGNQYVMIAYHTAGNLILQQAFPTKVDKHHTRFQQHHDALDGTRAICGSQHQR